MNSAVRRFAFNLLMAGKAILSPVALGAHAMIFDREGKVLLARHSYRDDWSLPGGGVARAEPPMDGLMRELREELGDVRADPPVFVGLYTRRSGWATNVITLYRLMNAEVDFRPNFEVREIAFFDPKALPRGTSAGARRRLAEYVSQSPPNPYW
jgi:8-oxo-dGTP pyrophosphatase MutT (NUDIX family)